MQSSDEKWSILKSRWIYRPKTPDEIGLKKDTVKKASGDIIKYVMAVSPYEVVFIVAVKDDKKVLLTRQYRYPFDEVLWGIPAGSPENKETLEEGAIRELKEETGFCTDRIKKLYTFYPSPGMTDQKCHIFLARDVKKCTNETAEIMEFSFMEFKEALELVYNNKIKDAGACIGLCIAAKQQGRDRSFGSGWWR